MNNHPPPVSFSDWIPPASDKHLTCSSPVQSPVTIVPRFWGLASDAHPPGTRVPCPHPKEIGLQQRWGESNNQETGLKVPGSTQKDQRMLCRGVRTGLPKYCIYLSFCLGLIDFLLTYFGFWLYILFSKWNPQWMHLWVFFMSNSTSLVTKLEKDIWGNCKVFHPGKFCGKHLQLTNFCLVW